MTKKAKWVFLISGGCALLCAPAVLIAERSGWSQWPFHVTQLVATLICLASSVIFIVSTRGQDFGLERSLAAVALLLSGLWLVFVCYVLLTLDLSSLD